MLKWAENYAFAVGFLCFLLPIFCILLIVSVLQKLECLAYLRIIFLKFQILHLVC